VQADLEHEQDDADLDELPSKDGVADEPGCERADGDTGEQVPDERAQAAPGLFACGADAGGIATGGYASGLAAALVFGRIAAAAALGAAASEAA
jgi:succinate dehydrogenase/fumarate reductase flavoprotein subunit